jgi:hypothetical protein
MEVTIGIKVYAVCLAKNTHGTHISPIDLLLVLSDSLHINRNLQTYRSKDNHNDNLALV